MRLWANRTTLGDRGASSACVALIFVMTRDFVGLTGTGKSSVLSTCMRQDAFDGGLGLALIDPHRDS